MNEIKPLKLIATYARVSTSNQEEQQTIKTQLLSLKEYSEKNEYTIVEEYIDNGWSGDMLARPSLDQLRQDAKQKKWEAVLIYDPDRLARRYSYQELVMDELKEAGIEVIFITIDAPKNSEDKILHGVRGLFAEYERAKISERFRLGKIRKVKEGHLLVSEALYGYVYIPKKDNVHGYYEINEVEAEVVRKIFDLVGIEKMSLKCVVKKLQELNIKPRKSKRGVWNTSTLSTMLRNKGYIGKAKWGSSYAVVPENPQKIEKYKKMKKTSRKIRSEDTWFTIPITSIIQEDLFEKVQNQLKENFSLCQRNKKNQYLVTGRIFCTCGRKRTGEGPKKGKHLYYRCTDRVLTYPFPATCKEKGMNARIVDQAVWDNISEMMSSPKLLEKQLSRWVRSKMKKENEEFYDINLIKKDISNLEKEEERYTKAYANGLFDVNKLKNYLSPIRDRIDSLSEQISKQQRDKNEIGTLLPTEEEVKSFVSKSKATLKDLNFETKRDIILSTVEKIIGTKESLQVYGYIPITSNHVEYKTINRHRRTSKRW